MNPTLGATEDREESAKGLQRKLLSEHRLSLAGALAGIEGRLAQPLPWLRPLLAGKILLECNRLFNAKCLEVPVPGVLLKPMQSLRSGVHGWLTVAHGFLQKAEITEQKRLSTRIHRK